MFGTKKIAEGISYKITGFDVPRLAGTSITLPLKLKLFNDSSLPIPIDSLHVNVSFLRNEQYVQAGQLTQGGFVISPGTQDLTIYPTLDLKAVFNNAWDTIITAVKGKNFRVKADIVIASLGFTATDTIYKDFTL